MWWKPKVEAAPPPDTRNPHDIMEQLRLLSDISKRTGILHDVQKLQLDYWIWIAIPNLVEHTLVAFPEDSVTQKTVWLIEYVIKTKGKLPKDFRKRMELIHSYIKAIFDDDIKLRVLTEDNKVVY